MNKAPSLSIVIPTLNRYPYLINTVKDLSQQSFKDFEIIIVDQTDRDQAQSVYFEGLDIKYYWSEIKSASLARNIGIKEARGKVILFIDDDLVIENKDFLKAHIDNYMDPKLCGVAGAVLDPKTTFRSKKHFLSKSLSYGWLFFPLNYDKEALIGSGRSCNMSVRTAFAKSIKGMDERYVKGAFREEADFCSRLVKKFGAMKYDPKTYVIHLGAESGGIRNFITYSPIKAQHHFNSMFYFTFKNVHIFHYPFHLISFLMMFFKKADIKRRPFIILELMRRSFLGIYSGLVMNRKGPLYLENDLKDKEP